MHIAPIIVLQALAQLNTLLHIIRNASGLTHIADDVMVMIPCVFPSGEPTHLGDVIVVCEVERWALLKAQKVQNTLGQCSAELVWERSRKI